MNIHTIVNETLEGILQHHCIHAPPALIIDSPPGAGKSWLTRRLAMSSLTQREERCLIVANTNEQVWSLCQNLCSEFPKYDFYLVHSKSKAPPSYITSIPNLHCCEDFDELPTNRPLIAVATADKCIYAPDALLPFAVMISDESYQLADNKFLAISSLARRWVLIGDPGQIQPIYKSNISRWKGKVDGPQLSAPQALAIRHPRIPVYRLPVSRRLPHDSVQLIQPLFYPQHPFQALSKPADRGLRFQSSQGGLWSQKLLQGLQQGQSILLAEFPATAALSIDKDLLFQLADFAGLLLNSGAEYLDDGRWSPLGDQDICIACAHVVEVQFLQALLSSRFPNIHIETFERLQGLERQVMLAVHPLSGRPKADEFHMGIGRMTVGLSRHRNACVLFAREGIKELLEKEAVTGERMVTTYNDEMYQSWAAQQRLLRRLSGMRRVIRG